MVCGTISCTGEVYPDPGHPFAKESFMFRYLLFVSVLCISTAALATHSAPGHHEAANPQQLKQLAESLHPLPLAQAHRLLGFGYPTTVYTEYQDQADFLRKSAPQGPPLQVAVGLEIDLSGADLFGKFFQESGQYGWLGALRSADAVALRVKVDLQQLADDEQLWLLDPVSGRSFGPFQNLSQDDDDGLWLPTLHGDTALLFLQSPRPSLPQVHASHLSHFYEELRGKQFDCPIEAACDNRNAVREASTAVGIMFATASNGGGTQCSGSLLNNADTEDLEPLFVTADHCFPRSGVPARNVEVVWDFRRSSCTGTIPNISSLPRSRGQAFLGISSQLDLRLLELDNVPVGTGGRNYLGWSTRAPIQGEAVMSLHHPGGNTLRLTFGQVEGIVDTFLGRRQTQALWNEGITEGGSSGSPILFINSNFTFFGVLSNGNQQFCTREDLERIDFYSSFRDFFPQIACHLTSNEPCVGGIGDSVLCPAKAAFGDDPEILLSLRQFRDGTLLKQAWGKELVAAYYAQAPRWAQAVQSSPEARDLFVAAALPFAWLGSRSQP